MRAANWKDYELIDTGSGERLERWGDILLIRPDPQIIWKSEKKDPRWRSAHARYKRSSTGGGKWEVYKKLPDVWKITRGDLTFRLKPMGFKHTGVFPEQAVNWDYTAARIRAAKEKNPEREIKILNLFGYTGAATLACMEAGATVTHVDASKGMVQWARENRECCGQPEDRVRWIIDDALKFVQREARRGRFYDGILMDPPSYGRGPGGEVWKLENELYGLAKACSEALSDDPLFFLINGYTTGFQASVLGNMIDMTVKPRFGGLITADEVCLPVTAGGVLPCGASGRWQRA